MLAWVLSMSSEVPCSNGRAAVQAEPLRDPLKVHPL
jgi:hypothetical protein